MRWIRFLIASVVSVATSFAQEAGAPPPFQVPAGFVVERVAGPPLVQRPMTIGFDDRGRLFACDSAGLNVPATERLKNLPDVVRLLEDTGGDGKFDKSTVFADKLSFALGPAWLDGAAFVGSAPSVWRMRDTDGDGVAEVRDAVVSKFVSSSSGNDLHKPVLGRDGRIYWTSGGFHGYEVKLGDGSVATGHAARLWRCKPEGSDVERLAGGGMDNPAGITFTEDGDIIGVTTFYTNPNNGQRDAILHWVEGVMFPKVHDLLREFKNTGDPMPALAHLGPAAAAAVTVYRSGAFGADYRGNLFTAQFNMHKVQRHILERDGATYRARSEDFLVSTSEDFHPTDVIEDADGSLLVVDTGGWYLQHCPTSRIAKPQVLGGIYRIRRADAPRVDDPRGVKIRWAELSPAKLTALLDDARFAVRDHAVEELSKRKDALKALSKLLKESGADVSSARPKRADGTSAPLSRLNAVWTLARIEGAAARALVRDALSDKDDSVRLAATHVAGLYRDADALPQLIKLLKIGAPQIRRNAATALGRIHSRKAVPALLDSLLAGGDRFLEHAQIYALIEIANRDATLPGLSDVSPLVRRGALIALDQMEGGNLTAEQVAPMLDPSNAVLQQTALKVITSHAAWAKEILGLTHDWLTQSELDETPRENLRGVIVAFSADAGMQELVATALRDPKTSTPTRVVILVAMAQASVPASWAYEVCGSLDSPEWRVVRQAVATIRATGAAGCDTALLRLANDDTKPEELRVQALAAAAPRLDHVEPVAFGFLIRCLDNAKPVLVRLAAAQALGTPKLNDQQLSTLARTVEKVGAFELPKLLPAFGASENASVGKELLAGLKKSAALDSVAPAALRSALGKFPQEIQQDAAPMLKRLSADVAVQKARLDELAPVLSGGDAARGREVFYGRKAGCSLCHSIGGQGGRVGPDVSKVGAIRSGRDLLEAIVFPSASFVRGYEPFLIETRDGRVRDGILTRETAEALYIYGADRIEQRIPRIDVADMRQGRVSVMPQGLDTQLSREELGDLIAFLLSLK